MIIKANENNKTQSCDIFNCNGCGNYKICHYEPESQRVYAFRYNKDSDYELKIWEKDRSYGVYKTPTFSLTDLEAIKKEVEFCYDENTKCIEIFKMGEDMPILRYNNKEWEDWRNSKEENIEKENIESDLL